MEREYLIGIDMGGSEINAGLVDLNGKVMKKLTIPIDTKATKAKIIDSIVFAVNKLKKDKILGVGIGVAGVVDVKRGVALAPPNLPGWKEVPLKRILEDKLKIPVLIDNDANCFAIAEYKIGLAKRMQNVVGVLVNSGISSGIVLGGKLCRTASGEIGHMTIDNREKCSCGNIGCLEAYSSGAVIEKKVKKLLNKKTITMEEIARLAKTNSKVKKIVADAAVSLGVGLANMALLLNPEIISIGGSVTSIKGFVEAAEKEANKRIKILENKVQIVKANTEDYGILGASSIAF